MQITDVKIRQISGTMEVDGPFMEERLAQPRDIYPEFRSGEGESFGDFLLRAGVVGGGQHA